MTSIGVSLPIQQGLVAPRSGNARALLNEIAGIVERLAAGSEGGSIDLRAIPLTEGDLEELHQVLGAGAVDARINALGESRVQETRYPGIWWVTHCNEAGDTVAELIEVCNVPAILFAPAEDIADGAVLLREALDNQESR